jgi:hypothetical protein
MNTKTTLFAFVILLLTPSLSVAGNGHCSAAMTAGAWDYTYTGTIFTANGPLPAASLGHYSQDSAGNVAGSQVRSVAGASGVEDISATISVQRDCTASAVVGVYVNGQLQRTANVAFVFDSDGNHMRAIFQSLIQPDGTNIPVVITIEGNKVFSKD